jgi:hypothetical protein
MSNEITALQNAEFQVQLLRARTQIYADATALMLAQLGVSVGIPVIGGLSTLIYPDARVHFAAIALLVLVLDPVWIDRAYKGLLKRAAKICERFDVIVLKMNWNQFVVGDPVETEDIHHAAKRYGRGRDRELRDWYPVEVANIPLHLARLICQRTNLRYDSQLRRHYSRYLIIGLVALALLVGIVSLLRNDTMGEWVLTSMLLAPLLSWALREFYRQRDTADQLEELMRSAKKLWAEASADQLDEATCAKRSRELQDAIYARRVSSTLIVPIVYRLSRARLEDEMNEAAVDFLQQYRDEQKAKAR